MRIEACGHGRIEDGPPGGDRLQPADRHRFGPAVRQAADLVSCVGQTPDAIVLVTTVGEHLRPLDPHGYLRRAVHRAFSPRAGTSVVGAGMRSMAGGVFEAYVRLKAGAQRVAVVAIDWDPGHEAAYAFCVSSAQGMSMSVPALERFGEDEVGRRGRGSLVGAARLFDAVRLAQAGPVMLDDAPRHGVAWSVVLGDPES